MKKKGLIVATIVMVLVLAVSLTTATYAWFTVSEVTTIEAFDISVVANNAVNIGVKTNNTYAPGATANDFMNGQVTYKVGTPGELGGGEWENGAVGLGATIDHDIVWGAQSAAVGVTTSTLTPDQSNPGYFTGAKDSETNVWSGTLAAGTHTVIAANAGTQTATDTLTKVTKAVANKSGTRYSSGDGATHAGDYAYLFIGAQPTKALQSNELVILITGDKTKGAIVGILSAVHVAYRLNSSGAWTDVDIFGQDNPATESVTENYHYNSQLTAVTSNLTTEQANAYKASYGETAPTDGAYAFVIDGLATNQTSIDQIEIVIYIAGDDSDCRDEAKGAVGSISIFFNAVASQTQQG